MYTGPAMRLVKFDTLAELDVGFTATGDFDSAAALSHCGGATACYIMTAYDQSGNGRHATQPVHGNRPQLFQLQRCEPLRQGGLGGERLELGELCRGRLG